MPSLLSAYASESCAGNATFPRRFDAPSFFTPAAYSRASETAHSVLGLALAAIVCVWGARVVLEHPRVTTARCYVAAGAVAAAAGASARPSGGPCYVRQEDARAVRYRRKRSASRRTTASTRTGSRRAPRPRRGSSRGDERRDARALVPTGRTTKGTSSPGSTTSRRPRTRAANSRRSPLGTSCSGNTTPSPSVCSSRAVSKWRTAARWSATARSVWRAPGSTRSGTAASRASRWCSWAIRSARAPRSPRTSSSARLCWPAGSCSRWRSAAASARTASTRRPRASASPSRPSRSSRTIAARDTSLTNRGDAAAATWKIPRRRVAATPRPRRGQFRGDCSRRRRGRRVGEWVAATAAWDIPRRTGRGRRGRRVNIPRRRVAARGHFPRG